MAYIFKTSKHYTGLINECINQMHALNIPISDSIEFKNNTGFSRFGFCKKTPYREGVSYVIAINKWFEDDIAIIETILHELVHTIPGCYNHGEKFRHYAEIINQECDLNISVVGNYKLNENAYKNKGSKRKVFDPKEYDQKSMVIMYCPRCLREFAIKKNAIRFNGRWVCRKCGRQLLYK
ncbi:MAG: hypothetical protein K5923_00935 [Clostridia bacterium]|nr:hypothetical protein [Clostridia bacterium]